MAEDDDPPRADPARHGVSPRPSTFLASAVAGRRMLVSVDDVARAWTDRETIVLPHGMQSAEERATVALQAALVASGSLDSAPMRSLARCRAPVADRFLVLEAARAARLLADLLPRSVVAAVDALTPDLEVPSSAWESLERARSEEALAAPPPWYGRVRSRALARSDAEDAGETGGAAPSERDRRGTAKQQLVQALDEEEAEEADTSSIMQKLSVPGMKNPFTAALQKLLGMGSGSSQDGRGAATDDLPVGSRRRGRVGRAAAAMRPLRGLGAMVAPRPVVGVRYPEWDEGRGRYRPDWCTVAEFDPRTGDSSGDPPADAPDLALRRELARLALRDERRRRRADGDCLDLTALVDHRVAVATGDAGEARVYEDVARTGRDLAVLVLLDATGSVGESDVFEEQVRVAARLSAGLEQVGDRVATYGFSSRGRENVRMLRVKGFDDRWDAHARSRLAALSPAGFTRLGAAVRHGAHLLRTQGGTANLLLVVVGDGFPHDDGYTGGYARADSRVALEEAAGSGIGCVGISVRGSGMPETLAEVWGAHPHRPLARYPELVRHVRPMFTTALGAASARRRPPAGAGLHDLTA